MKITKKFVKGALALALCVSMAAPVVATSVFAEEGIQAQQSQQNKVLKIKKVLTLPDTVTTPNKRFTFNISRESFNGDKTQSGSIPELNNNNRGAEFSDKDKDDMDGDAKNGKQIIKVTGDLLEGVNWQKAGQYTYKITEDEAKADKDGEEYINSGASYLVSIFVIEKDGKCEVENIQIKQENGDDGKPIKDAKKTPYTHGTGNNLDGNNFVFNNTYNKKAGNKNPKKEDDGNGNIIISDADKKGFAILKTLKDGSTTKNEFEFTLNITLPTTVKKDTANPKKYTIKIVKADGTVKELQKEYDSDVPFKLAQNEKAVLSDVYLGSTVKLAETDAGSCTPSIEAGTINGNNVTLENLKKGELVLGDNASGNFANFLNTPIEATGVLLANLPIIVLVAIGVGGIVFFAKNKKKEERQY